MKKLIRELMVLGMLAVATAGAFAQGKPDKQRPPKEPEKVVEPGKRQPPPPQNSNRPKPDNKKKP